MSVVTCAVDGSVFGVGSSNSRTYRHDSDGWNEMGEAQGSSIAAARRSKVWMIGTNGAVLGTSDGGDWRDTASDTVGRSRMIAAASDDSLWLVTNDNELHVRSTESGPFHPPEFADQLGPVISVAPVSASEVWAIGLDGTPAHVGRTEPVSPFGDENGDAEPSMLEVWSDQDGIRGVRLTMAGTTGRAISAGDIDPTLAPSSFVFTATDPPLALTVDTAGSAGVRRIVVSAGSGDTPLGPEPDERTARGVSIPLVDATVCGLFGEVTLSTRGQFLSAIGFSVRTSTSHESVLRHLNENAEHYSQAVWAGADELTLSRMLASVSYAPTEPPDPVTGQPVERVESGVPLGVNVDPRPIAVTGNYLAFRWTYRTEAERADFLRRAELKENDWAHGQETVVALPSQGVFAEAVLGRSNAAEKLDISRFWDWQDSPIPILPPDIAAVSLASRARDLDLKPGQMASTAAALAAAEELPAPAALQGVVQGLTADIFRDMSASRETVEAASKALEHAAAGEAAAGEGALNANKAAMEHHQAMTKLAIEAVEKLGPLLAAGATGGASGLGGLGGASGLGGLGGLGGLAGSAGGLGGAAGGAGAGGGVADAISALARNRRAPAAAAGALEGASLSKIGALLNAGDVDGVVGGDGHGETVLDFLLPATDADDE